VRNTKEDSWGDNLSKWVIPLFKSQTPQNEALSAQLAALAMMRGGTTSFVEAGTVIHMEAVMEALAATGLRGRVGQWVEGRAWDPAADTKEVADRAIKLLQDEVERWPDDGETLLAAWPVLVGHSTNPDEVWLAARDLARQHGLKVSAHMSPRQADPDWFLARYNRRPLEHLADIGVLGPEVCLTHLAAIDESELDLLVESGAGAIHCAHAAFLGGFGLARHGLHPEMLARGVPLMLGSDGMAADILSSARLMAAAYRDARADQYLLPPPPCWKWPRSMAQRRWAGRTASAVWPRATPPIWCCMIRACPNGAGRSSMRWGNWRPARRPRACTACGSPGGRCWRQVAI
jgi:cytosine/adenosine deaminase-related metal-dependent hydrolase